MLRHFSQLIRVGFANLSSPFELLKHRRYVPGHARRWTRLSVEQLEDRRVLTMPEASIAVMNSNNESGGVWVQINLSAPPETTVAVELEIRDLAGGLATADWHQPSTIIWFSVGATYYADTFYPVDDVEVEWAEDFDFVLTDPQGLELGYLSEARATISDNDLAPADLWAEWKTIDDTWEPLPDDEVAWADEEHRWLSSFAPPPNVPIDSIQWFARPWDEWEADPYYDLTTFETEWGMFTWADQIEPAGGGIYGELSIGVWAVTARVNFLQGFLLAAVPEKYQNDMIVDTRWEPGDAQQQFYYVDIDYPNLSGASARVFPEKSDPLTGPFNQVKVVVTLAQPVAAGKTFRVGLKALDPDHGHDPSNSQDDFDPNDVLLPSGAVDVKPRDNRQATDDPTNPEALPVFGERVGMSPVTQYIEVTALSSNATATFTIVDAQPGNNFIVATGHGPSAILSVKISDDDGFTPLIRVSSGFGGVTFEPLPVARYTPILDVWRTLWIERDSMRTPNVATEGPFDQPPGDVQYDKFPGDVPDVVVDLMAAAFHPANIEVKIVSAADDVTDNTYFTHNLDGALENAETKALSVSDWAFHNEYSFWVGHLIGAYEGADTRDFDGEELALMGIAKTGTNMAWVFHETIRDVSAHHAANPPPQGQLAFVGEAMTLQRTPLHESGHFFGLRDLKLASDPLNVMNYYAMAYLGDEFMRFSNSHLGRIQAQPKPTANSALPPDPTP